MGSDCCGPPAAPGQAPVALQQDENPDAIDKCYEACCSSSKLASKAALCSNDTDDICRATAPSAAEVVCQDGCCSATNPAAQDRCEDACYTSSKLPLQKGSKDAYCAPDVILKNDMRDEYTSPKPSKENPDDPSCCRHKATPCCDSSCLDRLAFRECNGEKFGDYASVHSCSSKRDAGKPSGPCSRHRGSMRKRYAARLEALGCICRTLLALGKESCCPTQERSSAERRQGLKQVRTSVDSCCAAKTTGTDSYGKGNIRKYSRSNDSRIKKISYSQSYNGDAKAKPLNTAFSFVDGVCNKEKSPTGHTASLKDMVHDVATVIDLEKGHVRNEHVVLSISGMTCTGCESKLNRTLGSLPYIQNLKTSLVLSRAEFDLNVAGDAVTKIMKHLERTTEFKCERILNQGASIDVIAPEDVENFLKLDHPMGVNEISAIGKKIVRLNFDAKVIGARDLLEKSFGADTPLRLAPQQADMTLEAGSKHVRHIGYMTLLSAILTLPVLVLAWAPLPEHGIAYQSASLALATIIQVVIAGPFYSTSLKSLIFSHVIEMDLLIVLSTTAAYIFSVISFGYMVFGRPLLTGSFFETSTLLVTLIMIGRLVGALARQKAVESISVRSLQTHTATLVMDDSTEREIDARLLQYGDSFKVAPDSRVPTDGTVVTGESETDESMITGESRPVEKSVRSALIAGSINGSGLLVARVTRLPGENTISTIAGMVDEAKLSKPKIQSIADKVASHFVPVVLFLAAITLAVWAAIGLTVRNQSGSEAVVNAITFAMSVLIVSCPCAIGLAVPMVIVIASGAAADQGVIFKSAEGLEIAHKTSHVVFDKTGTLTEGKLAVVFEDLVNNSKHDSTADLLLGLINGIKHPVSTAVTTHLKSRSVIEGQVNDVRALSGNGIEGTSLSGDKLRAGNSRWLNLSLNPRVRPVLDKGYTAFCFTINGSLAGVMGLEDTLRPDAVQTVSKLQGEGITVCLLSGDDDGAVRSIATQLNIADHNVRSRCSPSDKQAYIQELLDKPVPTKFGKKPRAPVVVFCGDGTNDAVALAQATIGVHINEGTDVAQSAADVVLMRPNLSGILTMINTSKVAMRRIRFNFGWSFVYNLFAILLAAGIFVNARIPPAFAGLGEIVSVLPVILAAVLLRWQKL